MGFKYQTTIDAVKAGDLEELKKMYNQRYTCSRDTVNYATAYGHLECLHYLVENGCDWDHTTINNAIAHGRKECLEYLHKKGFQWNDDIAMYAARFGQLDCLRYIFENGYKWDEKITSIAALYGNLNCLKYAIENGCKWSKETVKYSGIINAEYWGLAKKTDTKEAKFECFKYLFELMYKTNDNVLYSLTTPFDIIINDSCKYSECPLIKEFISFIDLDDQVWRRLFTIDLSKYPELEDKVNTKRKEIEELKHVTKDVLESILPSDIITYCIYPLF